MDTDRAHLSREERLRLLVDTMRSVSEASGPVEALQAFSQAMNRIFPNKAFLGVSTAGLEPGEFRIWNQVDHDQKLLIADTAFLRSPVHLPVQRGGFVADVLSGGLPKLLERFRCPEDPVLGDFLSPYRCAMAAPIFQGGEAMHWGIVLDRRAGALGIEDLEHFIMRVNLVSALIQSATAAAALKVAHDRQRLEMERIGAIQRALLPDRTPEIPGVRIAVNYETSDVAGGDLYDVHELGADPDRAGTRDGRWVIVIGDVSGHGPGAAVVMAMVESMLMSYPHAEPSPGEILRFLNRRLCHKRIEESFVTATIGIYDPSRRHLVYGSAGHPPILVRRGATSGGPAVEKLDGAGGPPLGVLPDVEYTESAVDLSPGDTLAFYTDGITEARSPDGGFFGVGGLEEAMVECRNDAVCVVKQVTAQVKRHEAGGPVTDDQTILAMEILG